MCFSVWVLFTNFLRILSRAEIYLWVLFSSVKIAADSIILCLDNERVYLSIVQFFFFAYISPLGPHVLICGCLFSCEEFDHSQIRQFCCCFAGSYFVLKQDKIHFWRDLAFPNFQSSTLSFSDMQAMAKAGKIICFVHELPTEAAFSL